MPRTNTHGTEIGTTNGLNGSQENVDACNIKDLVYSFTRTQILVSSSKLGIYDVLQEKGGSATLESINDSLRGDAESWKGRLDATSRLLNACASLGLLDKRTDDAGNIVYSNNAQSTKYLTSDSPDTMVHIINCSGQRNWGPSELKDTIEKGRIQVKEHIEKYNKDENVKKTESFIQVLRGMESLAQIGTHYFKDLDLSAHDSFMDLGGCLGCHARAIKEAYSDKKVILADVKFVMGHARTWPKNIAAKIEFESVDFLDAKTLPSTDCTVMAHILHDWNDDDSIKILKNVYQAMNKGGRVLLLEKVLNEDKTGPFTAIQADMMMMLSTSGKERSFSDYKSLLEKAGFVDAAIMVDPKDPSYDAVYAFKKTAS